MYLRIPRNINFSIRKHCVHIDSGDDRLFNSVFNWVHLLIANSWNATDAKCCDFFESVQKVDEIIEKHSPSHVESLSICFSKVDKKLLSKSFFSSANFSPWNSVANCSNCCSRFCRTNRQHKEAKKLLQTSCSHLILLVNLLMKKWL